MSKKSPQLRFEGFTDDWEERKLKDVVEKQIKGKAQFEKLAQGDVEYLDTSRLNGGQAILTNGLKDVTLDDILILWDGSKAGTVYHGFEGALGSTLKAYRTSANSKFVYQYLKRQQDNIYNNYRTPNIPHVQKDFLNVFTISVPGSDEQAKIGSFFKKLDDTIALHQRKLDLLKEQKKGYLQKMFPKNGAKVPELRFAGFADDWEERKLGEVFNQTVEYINPNEANLELWSVTVEKGLTPKTARYNREALVKKNDKFKVVHDGDIVYNPMNLTIGAVGFNKSEKSVAVSGYYVTMNMNSGFNNSYFQTWLKSENAIKQYKLYATGSLIEKQRVQFPTLSLIKSYIPTFEEQQKIGSFFKQLDDTIALHQRKLDLLKEQKKGFLQKMFL